MAKIPDYNKAAAAGAMQDVVNYPFRAKIDALAQMGGKAVIDGKLYDFTGMGNADNDAAMSDKVAQAMLDLQRNYGTQYIKQRLEDLKRSDPTGYAARKELFDRVLRDADAHPDRPLASELQAQVVAELAKGGQLSTGPNSETEAVQQATRGRQVANGIFLGNAPTSQEATNVVLAGDKRQQERSKQAMDFLNSGVSPEDVEYRRVQQSLSNLANAISGQSPTTEFSSLSGAQQGAAPFQPGNVAFATLNPNAAAQGIQNALDIYSGKVNWGQTQVNPWTAGISTGVTGAGALSQLGWNPFSSNPANNAAANEATQRSLMGGDN